LVACQRLGWAETEAGDSVAALAAYERAVTLMPQIAPLLLSRQDRLHRLSEVFGLPSEAAAAPITAGQSGRAVELLERARGILLAEAMDADRDLADLQGRSPWLAEEFL